MNPSITAHMALMHLALIAVPMLIAILNLEMKDWRREHPRSTLNKSHAQEAYFSRNDSVFST